MEIHTINQGKQFLSVFSPTSASPILPNIEKGSTSQGILRTKKGSGATYY